MVIHKIFFDTNIVLDIVDKYREKHTIATKILKYVILQNIEIVIGEDMLSTIYNISKNKSSVLRFFKIWASLKTLCTDSFMRVFRDAHNTKKMEYNSFWRNNYTTKHRVCNAK